MAVAGAGLYCLYAWMATNVFPAEEVVVIGAEGLPQQRLESIISEFVPKGTSLLQFRGRSLTRRLEEEALVASAQVRRRLPNTIILKLAQREPLAILEQGGQSWVCDRTGMVLGLSTQETADLPVIELEQVRLGPLTTGSRVCHQAVQAALEAISFLRAASSETPDTVRISQRQGMDIKLTGGPWIRLGPPLRLEEKLRLCLQLLGTSRKDSRVSLVDLSCSEYSYYEVERR